MRETTAPMMRLPFGDGLRTRIQGGDDDALLRAFVSLAAYWLEVSGASIHARHGIGATACMAQKDLHVGALMAAGLDLLRTLELSPQGRKAIADFCSQPFLQQTKGE